MWEDEGSGTGKFILQVAGFLLAIAIISSCGKSCSRSDSNMVYIREGFVYHEDSKIIYVESETGRYGMETSYTPYYDSNGSMCTYDIRTGEFIPINGGNSNDAKHQRAVGEINFNDNGKAR